MNSKRIDHFFDILVILILDFLSILFVLIPPFNQTPFRIIFALPILLFLPGYMLIAFMFTKREELSGIERFTLSVGLSIAIFVFDGFAISVTQWRFRPMPIIVSLTCITLFFTLLTLIRRFRTPEKERYFFGPTTISEFIESLKVKEEPTDIERALILALIGSIIIASGMLIYAKLTFEEEKFTALYILGKERKAENYPSELYILEKNPIIVGVENYEHANVNYILQVKLGGYILHQQNLTLNHNEKWEDTLYLTPKHVGKHLKLEFILYKHSRQPYRSVHLWVDSVINYDNLKKIREYALSELPVIEDSDMEEGSWKFDRNSNYFRGYYTELYNLTENSTLSGYVIDANTSEPIPNARISISNHYEYQKSVTTDKNGSYVISLIPDHYWISTNARGYNRNETEIDISAEELKYLNISIEKTKQLNLTVEKLSELNETIEEYSPEELPHTISVLKGYAINYLTGKPVSNASIRAIHELGFVQTTKTDENGYYELKVISGNHRIEIRAEGYAMNITNYRIGSVHELNLILTPEVCKIKGFVKDKEGRPVSDVYVNARSKQFSNSTRTNISGYYELYTIPGSFKLDVSKSGYFGDSTEFNITEYETKTVNLTIEKILPPSVIEGYIRFKNKQLAGVKVVAEGIDYRGNLFEKSAITDSYGFFKIEVLPGKVKVNVLQDYMKEKIEFQAKSGKKIRLSIQLDSNPESTFKIIYPSQTPMSKGSYSEIYQNIESMEGIAALSFKVSDSYRSDRQTAIFKQVLLNGHVIWEDDIAGDEGWKEVKIPVTFDEGENRISMRVYAKKDSRGPVTVQWDDIKIEPIGEILKEKATVFNVTDAEGGKNYTTSLYLGKPEEFIVSIENNEQEKVNYTLQVELGGVPLREEHVILEDGEKWKKRLSITPSAIGEFLKLEFILLKDSSNKPYKYFSLWVSSEIDYSNIDVLSNYVVPLPELVNWNMESSLGWIYTENDLNFTGGITATTSVSPYHSFEIYTASCNRSCFAGIYQNFSIKNISNAIISFNVKDSFKQARAGNFYKQVLLNDEVIWEDDIAGDEGWLYKNIPVTIHSGENSLMLRVYGGKSVSNFPIKVWWDNILLKPVTEILNETTVFEVHDITGGENYPSTLYLGIPSSFIVNIENKEGRALDYTLRIKLGGILLKEERIRLNNGETWRNNVSVTPVIIGDNLLLEFILLKDNEAYRYFSIWVSSEIDYSNLNILKEYEVSVPPPVDNGDMESSGEWRFSKHGQILWEVSNDVYSSGNRSLRVYQDGYLRAGDFVSAYQDIGTIESGVVFITFSVMDDYEDVNTTGLLKQVLLNDEVIWEDDIAGSEGWQKLRIPVYFSGMNRLTLKVYAEKDVEYSYISVYWDDVDIESITGGLS